MSKKQILWIIGLNIASYLIIKGFEKIISLSPKLPQILLQYFEVNLYYALFVAVLNIAILYFILRRQKKSEAYINAYNGFVRNLNNAITRYRGYLAGTSTHPKYTDVGVLEMMNDANVSRMQLLLVCGKNVKSYLNGLGTGWFDDMQSFYDTAQSVVQMLPEIADRDK